MEKLISNLFPEQKRVVISNLNINSLPNKFNQPKELVLKHEDILVLTEPKLDNFFRKYLFQINSFQLIDTLKHLGLTEIIDKKIDLEVG